MAMENDSGLRNTCSLKAFKRANTYVQQFAVYQAADSSVTATMTALHNKFAYSEYQITATLVSNALALGYSPFRARHMLLSRI